MGAIGLGADLCRESRHHASLLLEIANDVEPSDTTCVRRGGFQRGQQPKVMVGDLAARTARFREISTTSVRFRVSVSSTERPPCALANRRFQLPCNHSVPSVHPPSTGESAECEACEPTTHG